MTVHSTHRGVAPALPSSAVPNSGAPVSVGMRRQVNGTMTAESATQSRITRAGLNKPKQQQREARQQEREGEQRRQYREPREEQPCRIPVITLRIRGRPQGASPDGGRLAVNGQ